MTIDQPGHHAPASESNLSRIALWVAIGALIAAALISVVWVLVGTQNNVFGQAILTVLLLAAFAGVSLLEARLAPRRPSWFVLTSMIVWVVTLILGAVMIWMPATGGPFYPWGIDRFMSFLVIVLILQLAVLHVRLFVKAYRRRVTTFTTVVTVITIGLVAILAVMLVFPLAFHEFVRFLDAYWRWLVAFAILAAVGTALLPLVNALFASGSGNRAPAQQAWPTYVDGITPLPYFPDGSPDWNAYYTGYPSPGAQAFVPVPGYDPYAAHPVEQHPAPHAASTVPADAAHAAHYGQAPYAQYAPPSAEEEQQSSPLPVQPAAPLPHTLAYGEAQQDPRPFWEAPIDEQTVASPRPEPAPAPQPVSPPPVPGYQGYPPPPPLPPQR